MNPFLLDVYQEMNQNIPEHLIFEMLHNADIYIHNKEQLKIYVKHYMDSCKQMLVIGKIEL